MAKEVSQNKFIDSISKIITWGVFGFTTLIIALYFFFQLPSVQKWGIAKITNTLSSLTGAEVEIQNFKVFFLDRLQIKGISITDPQGNVILKGGTIDVNINFNTIQFLRDGFALQKIKLTEIKIYDLIDQVTGKSTLNNIIEEIQSQSSSSSNEIILKGIELEKFDFIQKEAGNERFIQVKNGFISINSLKEKLQFNLIELNNPIIKIQLIDSIGEYPDKIQNPFPELIVKKFDLNEGAFEYQNQISGSSLEIPFYAVNYKDLKIKEIDITLENFSYCEGQFSFSLPKFSGKEKSGFILNQLSVQEAFVSNQEISLTGLEILTPNSHLKDLLIFKYKDFKSFGKFVSEVDMDINFNQSKVFVYDVLRFAPKLMENSIFRNNKFRTVDLNGRVFNAVSFLKSSDLELNIQGIFNSIIGFEFKELDTKDRQFAVIDIKKFNGNSLNLESLFPGTTFNKSLLKVGQFELKGLFRGSFKNFKVQSILKSPLGLVKADFNLNISKGKNEAIYNGELFLNDFDLGVLTENTNWKKGDFFLKIIKGKGLTLESADVYLEGRADNLFFKDYNYQNAEVIGQLNNNRFNGQMVIKDENIDFEFKGNWTFNELPLFDFKAQVNHLDFKRLNLFERNIVFKGLLDFQGSGNSLETIEGDFLANDIIFIKDDKMTYRLDSIHLIATSSSDAERKIVLESDVANAEVVGNIPIIDLDYYFKKIISSGFPQVFGKTEIDSIIEQKNLNGFLCGFQIEIIDDKGFSQLIDTSFGILKGIKFHGYLDSYTSILDASAEIPFLSWKNYELNNIEANIRAKGVDSEFDLTVDNIQIGKTIQMPFITFLGFRDSNELKMAINIESFENKNGNRFKISTSIVKNDSGFFELKVLPSGLQIFNESYKIDPNNKLIFGKSTIKAFNFFLAYEDKSIVLKNYGDKGISLALNQFDFDLFNQIIKYPLLKFHGKFDGQFAIGNLFEFSELNLSLFGPSLLINGDDWGAIQLNGKAQSPKNEVYFYTTVSKQNSQVINETKIIPLEKSISSDFKLSEFSLDFAEYFTKNSISNIKGNIDAQFSISGPLDQVNIQGNGVIKPGSFKVDFLKTDYSFDTTSLKISNNLFDITGAKIFDIYRNQSLVKGGIVHNRLKNLGYSVRLETDKFLGLNTQKGDNNLFYGHALGRGEVSITGSFQQPNIYVNATVGDSTLFVIPVSSEQETSPLSFINFINESATSDQPLVYRAKQSTGLELEMDLTITNPAVVKIIFDEQAGDILEGSGRGSIKMIVPRNANFQMFGDYEIERGNYLFTLVNVINKNFNIQKGGLIRWTGDPFNADINLVAAYADLNTSVANFIQEYLVNASDASRAEASNATNVNLKLLLQGKLLQPKVNFDISFPNLTGEVQSFTDSKLRLLKQDPNEFNKQVIGLILAGQFFPADFSFQGADFFYNTVSEFFSNQISLLLTQFFSELIAEGDVLSGIDFDIAYSQYQKVNVNESEQFNKGDELKLRLTQNYFNDRLTVLLGGNLEMNNRFRPGAGNTGTFLGNDLVIEYSLTKDRSLKVRVYQRLQPDFSGRRMQVGTGLSYRKEFNSFDDFWKSFKKNTN